MRLPCARIFVVGCMEFDWVVRWVGSYVQSFYSATGWVGLGQSFSGLCLVEEIGPPTDSSDTLQEDRDARRHVLPVPYAGASVCVSSSISQ